MKEIFNTIPEIVKTNPMQEIMALQYQIQQEGNVDSELNTFADIHSRIEKGIITPDEGLEEARNMVDRRQNYH